MLHTCFCVLEGWKVTQEEAQCEPSLEWRDENIPLHTAIEIIGSRTTGGGQIIGQIQRHTPEKLLFQYSEDDLCRA